MVRVWIHSFILQPGPLVSSFCSVLAPTCVIRSICNCGGNCTSVKLDSPSLQRHLPRRAQLSIIPSTMGCPNLWIRHAIVWSGMMMTASIQKMSRWVLCTFFKNHTQHFNLCFVVVTFKDLFPCVVVRYRPLKSEDTLLYIRGVFKDIETGLIFSVLLQLATDLFKNWIALRSFISSHPARSERHLKPHWEDSLAYSLSLHFEQTPYLPTSSANYSLPVLLLPRLWMSRGWGTMRRHVVIGLLWNDLVPYVLYGIQPGGLPRNF